MPSTNNTVIIDTSLHAMRFLHVAKKEETEEEGFQLFKYYFLSSIFEFIKDFDADELIMAIDSKKNWRKKVFPYYKSKRAIKRKRIDDEDHDWFSFENYYNMLDEFLNDIKENFPFKFVEVDFAEADDIAGVLTASEQLAGKNKILVTADQDYIQLLQNNYTKLYNPIKKEFVISTDPKRDLLEKIVLGDSGDDIPSIKDRHKYKPEFFEFCVNEGYAENEDIAKIKIENSEEDFLKMELKFYTKYYLKPTRATKFSKKLFNSLYDEGLLQEHIANDKILKERFKRNNKLINLTAQPKELKNKILEKYEECETRSDLKNLFEYFIVNNFNDFMNNNAYISQALRPLCS
jgi:hypothetical protein